MKKRLTVPEVANELGVTRQHVYNLINAGLVGAIVISISGNTDSSSLRVDGESLQKFIDDRKYSVNNDK